MLEIKATRPSHEGVAVLMISKPVALIRVPNGSLYSVNAIGTIRKLTDLNVIQARV